MDLHQGVIQEFENTDPAMIQQLLESPSLMDAWISEVSERIEVTPEVVKTTVEVISARQDKDIDKIVMLTNQQLSVVHEPPVDEINYWVENEQQQIRRDIAIAYLRRRRLEKDDITYAEVSQWMPTESQIFSVSPLIELPSLLKLNKSQSVTRNFVSSKRENIRQGVLISEISKSLKHFNSHGATKTQILRHINKDTSRWRTSFDSVIQNMINSQSVYKVRMGRNELYFAPQYHNIVLENDIHRKIYEFLKTTPSTQTAIVKFLTYNNSKGHRRVKEALKLLYTEGLVIHDGSRWKVLE